MKHRNSKTYNKGKCVHPRDGVDVTDEERELCDKAASQASETACLSHGDTRYVRVPYDEWSGLQGDDYDGWCGGDDLQGYEETECRPQTTRCRISSGTCKTTNAESFESCFGRAFESARKSCDDKTPECVGLTHKLPVDFQKNPKIWLKLKKEIKKSESNRSNVKFQFGCWRKLQLSTCAWIPRQTCLERGVSVQDPDALVSLNDGLSPSAHITDAETTAEWRTRARANCRKLCTGKCHSLTLVKKKRKSDGTFCFDCEFSLGPFSVGPWYQQDPQLVPDEYRDSFEWHTKVLGDSK